jgi:hypothetical protein
MTQKRAKKKEKKRKRKVGLGDIREETERGFERVRV